MRIGSLCSGAGALDLAVEAVFGAETVWHCEINDAASKVLAHRWPGIPNHRDLTTTDWGTVEPVDILTGGYPCQPFSHAGQRKGTDDERHIWPDVREAIRRVRPRYTILENVAGHRSLGFDRVLGDLAEDGYDAQWCSVRASDVGAPHRRERLFVLAVDANTDHAARDWERARQEPRERGADVADSARDGRDERRPESAGILGGSDVAVGGDGPVADAACGCRSDVAGCGGAPGQHGGAEFGAGDRDRERSASTRGELVGRAAAELAAVALLPTPNANLGEHRRDNGQDPAKRRAAGRQVSLADELCYLPTPAASRSGNNQSLSPGAAVRPSLDSITDLLPTPRKSDGDGGANPLSRAERMDDVETRVIRLLQTPSAADGDGSRKARGGNSGDEPLLPGQAVEMAQQWGKYDPAIRRWEAVTRPAPSPTEPNTRGNPRLAAPFPEWMMGWPAGWVTDVPGISRNDALRIIGNGVVTLQAIAALRWLLQIQEVAA